MIEFLKESTFAVNDVIRVAWKVLKIQYLKILGLCLIMFVVFNLSGILSIFISGINIGLSIFMMLIFILAYFGFQLTLFKFILKVLDEPDHEVYVKDSFPTTKQIFKFLIATFYFVLCILIVYGIIIMIVLPFVFVRIPMNILTQVATSLGVLGIIFTWIRISFFPFFIIDRDCSPFKSIRFSMAITRGNFTKLLMLLMLLAIFQGLYIVIYSEKDMLSAVFINLVNSLLIIPLSSVAIAVAYRKMMNEYQGEEDPGIMGNII
ncbi:hypothetical protein [Arcticibacter eurypsychrophilus]|uniref:hypothetical protein n=1 Tax=Arcticibacter eurypsychrophilus TaxID=1434752 RepID=UPI00084D5589|nr:hypothetical protein [Arcticibacter eurypsychrophilus]